MRQVLKLGHLTVHLSDLAELCGHVRGRVDKKCLEALHPSFELAERIEELRRRLLAMATLCVRRHSTHAARVF